MIELGETAKITSPCIQDISESKCQSVNAALKAAHPRPKPKCNPNPTPNPNSRRNPDPNCNLNGNPASLSPSYFFVLVLREGKLGSHLVNIEAPASPPHDLTRSAASPELLTTSTARAASQAGRGSRRCVAAICWREQVVMNAALPARGGTISRAEGWS